MAEGHVCGGIIPRNFLKFQTRKYYFLHSERPKTKTIINNIYHYLVVEKHNNLNRFGQTRTKDKAQNFLSVYLFVILRWFICIILGKRDFSWGGGQNVISWGGAQGGTGGGIPPPSLYVKKGPE
jgi:hypothetical protein